MEGQSVCESKWSTHGLDRDLSLHEICNLLRFTFCVNMCKGSHYHHFTDITLCLPENVKVLKVNIY